jgi:hypothetical protein
VAVGFVIAEPTRIEKQTYLQALKQGDFYQREQHPP